jgi:four helix bundle protein
MNPKADQLKARTKTFALDVLKFRRTLPNSDDARDIGRQLMRAATAVGSNYRSSCRSRSDAEFAARIGVVLEEADESLFWLEVVTEDGLSRTPLALRLLDEAGQLTAIFAASTITARAKATDPIAAGSRTRRSRRVSQMATYDKEI